MAVTCKNCGGAHAIWECKRPATKSSDGRAAEPATKARRSTASLKEVTAFRETVRTDKAAEPLSGYTSQAGTQALPVDTNPPQGSKGLSDDGREVTLQRPVEGKAGGNAGGWEDRLRCDLSSPIPPATKFDKKAWSRAYMKIWMRNKRAKLKLERENAK